MNDQIMEALCILQEECAEVIQEISKCRRFGLDSKNTNNGIVHKDLLSQEIGDVMCLLDILVEQGVVSRSDVFLARDRKREKLKQWSNIFKD